MEKELGLIIQATVAAWNEQDIETLSNYLTEDIVLHHPGLDEPLRGKKNYLQYDRDYLVAFPDSRIEIVNLVSGDNLVAFEFIIHGTHQREFKGRPETGKRIRIPIVEMTSFRDRKICEVRRYLDTNAYAKQLS